MDTLYTDDGSASLNTAGPAVVPCLTILAHPDLSRIGERVLLPQVSRGKPLEIARNTPEFLPPTGGEPRALDIRGISRSPLTVQRRKNGDFKIVPPERSRVRVDGEPVDGEGTLSKAAFDDGAIIEVGSRIALYFHQVTLYGDTPGFGLIGHSDGLMTVRRAIAQVADLNVPVLIHGESGTGKEKIAQALHAASPRSGGPCVPLNMATIQESMAASELFGHTAGAFTGASGRRRGAFERAHGGTLFLDEVGETPEAVQPMLLRVLETGQVAMLGSERSIEVDVRVVSATDAEVTGEDAVIKTALYQRLRGYEIRVPPLRERRDDIPRLAIFFLREILEELGDAHRLESSEDERAWLRASLLVQFTRAQWPGNVRELRNVIRQIAIASRGHEAPVIDASVEAHLGEKPNELSAAPDAVAAEVPKSRRNSSDLPSEDEMVAALEAHNWAVGPAAAALDIPRPTLYDLIERSDRVGKATDLDTDAIASVLAENGGDLALAAKALRVSRRALQLRMKALGVEATQ